MEKNPLCFETKAPAKPEPDFFQYSKEDKE